MVLSGWSGPVMGHRKVVPRRLMEVLEVKDADMELCKKQFM